MKFKKNDRVMFISAGEEIHGVVFKGGEKTKVVDDTAKKAYAVPQPALMKSDRPLTPELKKFLGSDNEFSKGDRVMFKGEGRMVHGTVTSSGAKLKVREDGGMADWSIPARAAKASDAPVKKDPPHEMDRWGLSSYKAFPRMSEETEAFDAFITLDGKKVINASNRGHGGCNSYYPEKGETQAIIAKFEATAKDWMVAMGYPEKHVMEAGDHWVGWKANLAPYNVTAQEDVQASLKQFREWGMDLEAEDDPAPKP